MQVAIRGYGSKLQLINQLRRIDEINVKYAIDKNQDLWGTVRDGLEYISPMRAYSLYEKGEIEKIFINSYFALSTMEDICKEMQMMGFEERDICVPSTKTLEEGEIKLEDIVNGAYEFSKLRRLQILQYHIADHCNLNCKGCNHFSPLVKDKVFPELEKVVSDLKRIREVVDVIDWIAILGGEPLLNPNWKAYAKVTRELWENSYISIFTNGLLVRRLSDEDIAFLKEWDIAITISLYKINWGIIDEIICWLREKGVKCKVDMAGGPICEFTSSFNLDSHDDYIEKRKMCTQKCTCIRDGKMTPCAPMMFVNTFNDYFNKSLPEEKPVDIWAEDFTFETLRNGLNKPMEICKFCDRSSVKKWENASHKNELHIEDWLI